MKRLGGITLALTLVGGGLGPVGVASAEGQSQTVQPKPESGGEGTGVETPATAPPGASVPAESPELPAVPPTAGPPRGAELERTTALLARLHQAAQRQVQLGELAQGGAANRATRAYGADLASDFRALDGRVIAFAAENGVGEDRLNDPVRGENVVALRRHTENLTRLAGERGETFDRDFWVAVAGEQSASSDMLPSAMLDQPALSGLVSDFSAGLDRASARALVAARPTESAPPSPASEQPPTVP